MTSFDEKQELGILARHYGIADHYFDIWGTRHEVSPETMRSILTAMGVNVATREELAHAVSALHARYWRRVCDPVLVLRGQPRRASWSVRLPSSEEEDRQWSIVWGLENEAGVLQQRGTLGPGCHVLDTATVEGVRHIRLELMVSDELADGYYELTVRAECKSRRLEAGSLLVLAPPTCYLPPDFEAGRGTWGLWTQLYSLRSQRNWGIGDFSDLAALIRWAGGPIGAGAIGVNPLHALKNTRPYHISPYSPQSRTFLNEIYLDVEAVPEFGRCREAQRLVESDGFRSRLDGFRKSEWVDYEGIHRAKLDVLELLYRQFVSDTAGTPASGGIEGSGTRRREAFDDYRRGQGDALEKFAVFLALTEHLAGRHPAPVTWRDWPAEYLHPHSASVEEFRRSHDDRIRFHQYVQWQAHEQLAAAKRVTADLGMVVGLYHDFALGSDPSGAEGWRLQDVLVHGADCGAPPDPFALQGQNWGFPPFHPVALREHAYRPFIALLRQNLPRGGALRLDHVMGLFRLFWIPKGRSAVDGAYVEYPYEDLLGILAMESQRARTIVIGEDLGTVPEWIRDKLAEVCAFSYRVWYFERQSDGTWKSPEQYPVHSLAVSTTHDLPTLPGFWQGDDLHVRERLELFPDREARQRAWDERERDKQRMLEALRAYGEFAGHGEDSGGPHALTPHIMETVHRFLARTSSLMVLASLDDWVGEVSQANVPGTLNEYPNWSRKTAVPIESLPQDVRCLRLAELMRQERGRGTDPRS